MTPLNRNLLNRVVVAAVLAPLLLLAVLAEDMMPLALILHLAVVLGLAEFFRITLRDDPTWLRLLGLALGAGLSVGLLWWPDNLQALIFGLPLVVATLHLIGYRDPRLGFVNASVMLFGMFYVAVLLTTVGLLRQLPQGAAWVILALTITWFCDTGAYAAGRLFGKRPLYPAISPGKTVEGAIGGLIFAVGAGVLARLWYMPSLPWVDVFLLTIQAGALAQVGDLVESMIKRAHQVKDSGRLIPGHGGLLDRIDALLFVTPYVYLYAKYIVLG